jgi:hypothetical protein
MGLFKQMKQMKDVVAAAPGLVEQAQELGARGYTMEQAPSLAAERGIAADDWHAAVAGWNQRMAANPAVALEFNRLYQGA